MSERLSPYLLETVSPIVIRTKEKLKSLPLDLLYQKGINRKREDYFLNISYPSLQAMKLVQPDKIYPANQSKGERKVALYTHVPFCKGECHYCHYYKVFGKKSNEVDEYIDAVAQELFQHRRNLGGIEAQSLYIGGGTPSYLSPDQIDRLLTTIKEYVHVPKNIEATFELHPENATEEKMEILRKHAINRINIGVESFDDIILKSENRRHTANEAIHAFKMAKRYEFDNINIDLIYGLQYQTIPLWEETLKTIETIQPPSVTMYYLRIKKGTPEYKLWVRYPERFPSEEDLLVMHAMNFEFMESQLGYTQNPVDWYVKDSSKFHQYQDHNWRKTDQTELLGIGPSAYSYVNGWQYYNINDIKTYQDQLSKSELPIWRGEYLSNEEKMRRTIILGIKMGMNRTYFKDIYGVDVIKTFAPEWERLTNMELVHINETSVELTYMGKLFADEVGQLFYSVEMKRRMNTIDPYLISTTWPQLNPIT